MKQKTVKKYALYLRCSTDDQTHRDYSTIDTQRDKNTERVKSLNGKLVEEYVDEGKTGTNLKRPGWERMLQDADANKFDVVVCTYMSRLARGEAYNVAEYLLKERGVCVELVQECFTPDLAGHVNKQMTILMDGMYPKMVAQWTKTKMEQMVVQGYYCGGTKPYGYETEVVSGIAPKGDKEPPKRLVVKEDEAEIVRDAFSLYAEKHTIADVRRYLNSVSGRQWTTTTVRRLLSNPVYIGNYSFGEWTKENSHPAIISVDLWETVRHVLEAHAELSPRTPRCDDYTYYLHGLIKCPHCGCSYSNSIAKGGAVHYYECLDYKKNRSKCPVARVNADALHDTVLREIQRATQHHTVMHKLIAESGGWENADGTQKSLRAQLAKKKQFNQVQIDNMTAAIAEGRALEALLRRLEKLEAEKEAINHDLQSIEAQIAQATVVRPTAQQVQRVWGNMLDLWDCASDDDRSLIMQSVVREITVREKSRVSLVLLATPEVHDSKFAITKELGAGRGFEPLTFGL